jgi:hypothetical protein
MVICMILQNDHLRQALDEGARGSAGVCCRVKPYDLQEYKGQKVIRERIKRRMEALWRDHGYIDIEVCLSISP